MEFDTQIAVEKIQSEAVRAVYSLHDYKSIDHSYFDRFRDAVQSAMEFFDGEIDVPNSLLEELKMAARIIRNEAIVFEGRTKACLEMAEWLESASAKLSAKSNYSAQ